MWRIEIKIANDWSSCWSRVNFFDGERKILSGQMNQATVSFLVDAADDYDGDGSS